MEDLDPAVFGVIVEDESGAPPRITASGYFGHH